MALQASTEKLALCDEVQLSYFVRSKERKTSRVAHARLIDISEAGLCMEISPLDSDIFMESQGHLFIVNGDVEMQLFCRSHPDNLFLVGGIKWFRRKKELDDSETDGKIYVGVLFSGDGRTQKKDIVELIRHLKTESTKCSECGARISTESVLCYNCGAKTVRKRTIFKKMIFSFLANDGR
jgi:ribosomal protein L40E